MTEANLETVNRTLSAALRKSEEDVKKLRYALLKAATSLALAGYHNSAEMCMETWKETQQ